MPCLFPPDLSALQYGMSMPLPNVPVATPVHPLVAAAVHALARQRRWPALYNAWDVPVVLGEVEHR